MHAAENCVKGRLLAIICATPRERRLSLACNRACTHSSLTTVLAVGEIADLKL